MRVLTTLAAANMAAILGTAPSGCFGLFANGDPVTLIDTFTLSPKQVITSP